VVAQLSSSSTAKGILLVWTAYLRGSVDGFAAVLGWLLEHQSTV
jgi:hypothetical protein